MKMILCLKASLNLLKVSFGSILTEQSLNKNLRSIRLKAEKNYYQPNHNKKNFRMEIIDMMC